MAAPRSRDEWRVSAVRVLTRVLSDFVPLDDALAPVLGALADARARAWLQDVCSGTLRWKGRIDLALDSLALKKKPSGRLRKHLLIAGYQILAQERTAPAPVVSETVDAVRKLEGEAPARFANAILRTLAEGADAWRDLPWDPTRPEAEAARWASLPDWLWRALLRDHGAEWARDYALASLERPKIWVKAKDPSALPSGWAMPGPLEGAFEVTEGGAIAEKPGFAEGNYIVQDISSQFLAGEIATLVRETFAGKRPRVLDLCAAPGGKAVALAWNGLEVIATDRADSLDDPRMRLLLDTVKRAEKSVRVVKRSEAPLGGADLIWVDAPCTGSGILRRHPDVRWLRKESDLAALVSVQQQLLKEAWSALPAGGMLAYSVCSVLKDEGPRALAQAGIEPFKTWFLVPHASRRGDGFWAGLARKN